MTENENTYDPNTEGQDPFAGMGDFDLEGEFKPTPLVPNGTYKGNLIEVKMDTEVNSLNFKVCLADNGGLMSDGETPIDGSHHTAKLWLPKKGDENELTKDGKMTKRQSKINMMKQFVDRMKLDMNTAEALNQHLANQDWIGLPVWAKIKIDTYEGRNFNTVDSLRSFEG